MRLSVVLLWLSLVVWCAAAAVPGAAAMAAFATLPREGLAVPRLAATLGQDSDRAGRYAAGRMLQPLFDATDGVQMLAGALAITMLLRLWRLRAFTEPRWLGVCAVVLVLAAGAALAARLSLASGLRANLHAYWQALEKGDAPDAPAALDAKAAFDADHRVAERLSSTGLLLQLATVAVAAAALAPGGARATRDARPGPSAENAP
jgi:hypothetical protein